MPRTRRLSRLGVVAALGLVAAPLTAVPAVAVPGSASTVFINELHYDNTGADVGEFVEVAAPAGTDLSGYGIVLYNGSNETSYATLDLPDAVSNVSNGYGFVSVDGPSGGIQNGSPDGVALLSGGAVVQFLSYEGAFTATNGPASGQTSTDIGVQETNSTPVGASLSLVGTGATYGDFTWAATDPDTRGSSNAGQIFAAAGNAPVVATCDPEVTTGTGEAASAGLSASDADGRVTDAQITSDPVTGINVTDLTPAAADGDPLTATVSVADTTPAGEYAVQVTFSNDDSPAQTASCTVDVTVVAPPLALTIEEIQGEGAASPYAGERVVTRGVVTAAYPSGGFFGFVIQTPGTGGSVDPDVVSASPAVFVYYPFGAGAVGVQPGQYVEVTGEVSEFNGLTEVVSSADGTTTLTESAAPVAATTTAWPTTDATREKLESVLFAPTGTYTVTNTFTTNQYGEVGLAFGDTPLMQPTDVARPGTAGYDAAVTDNAARAVTLDDGATTNFLNSSSSSQTPPYISLADPVRVGAQVLFNQPLIVDFRNDAWKLNPTTRVTAATPPDQRTTFKNTRTPAPDAAGIGDANTTVASFNVLNYFTTLGADTPGCTSYDDRTGDPVTVRGGCDVRGAFDPEDFERQQAKIVAAINAVDASVIGLMEIENSAALGETPDEATATLVAALNAAAGAQRWAYVPSSTDLPPADQQDVITNAIIYQPLLVTPLGAARALGDQSEPGEAFSNAREPIAQVFAPTSKPGQKQKVGKAKGEPFLVAVNHFKSKGSATFPQDADAGDGQGTANYSRVRQATALRDWVPTVLAEHNAIAEEQDWKPVEDVFLLGDFNSYTQEDPLQVLYDAGYTDVNNASGNAEQSYNFGGQNGSLDHVIANASAMARVTGSDIWSINSPESVALEYSRYNYHGTLFYAPDPYRSSDHDPVIVGMDAPKQKKGAK